MNNQKLISGSIAIDAFRPLIMYKKYNVLKSYRKIIFLSFCLIQRINGKGTRIVLLTNYLYALQEWQVVVFASLRLRFVHAERSSKAKVSDAFRF